MTSNSGSHNVQSRSPRLVVIAASAGGFPAVSRLIGPLPPSLNAAVIILQHRAATVLSQGRNRRLSDFKTNEYARLAGGGGFEPREENPMIGFRGASRYYDERYRAGFALECRAMKRVRDEMGLTNVKLMVPFCRTLEEARRVVDELARNGLRREENGLELYMMVEIPSNVILLSDFAEYFDGFSIGSNDLTQLTLGVDRDSETVAHVFDERDQAVRRLIARAIDQARSLGRKIGLCGQAPSDYPEFARFLVAPAVLHADH